MESYELNACVDRLNRLKKDVQYRQKKGLPFILASVIIWALILLSRIAAADLRTANLMTFICCCLLIPLATLFSKLLKADIFRKTGNIRKSSGDRIIYHLWKFYQKFLLKN